MTVPVSKITQESPDYPGDLLDIPNPPQTLYYLGELPRRGENMIAIVGTRKATREGRDTARSIARELAAKGIVVVSGLALGIDGAAHEGALKGSGKTIAVLGNGLDEIYPRTHEWLGKEILKSGGGILSEYPEGTEALAHHFLERNRIVSGLSKAVVVIEAPMRSGSLVTAKCALEQGREVFVVPGPVGHPNYEGSHELIRNGARLVRNASDILEDLGIEAEAKQQTIEEVATNAAENFDEATNSILALIKKAKEALTLDEISEQSDIPPHVAAQKVSTLVITDIVEEKAGTFSLKRNGVVN